MDRNIEYKVIGNKTEKGARVTQIQMTFNQHAIDVLREAITLLHDRTNDPNFYNQNDSVDTARKKEVIQAKEVIDELWEKNRS